jgi:hypothetical protein
VEATSSLQKKPFSYWLKKNWYYHCLVKKFYQAVVPAHQRVLQIGCKNGYILQALLPSYGVGIDEEEQVIAEAQKSYPQLIFYCGNLAQVAQEPFDYIIISSVTMEVYDVEDFFVQLQPYCYAGTRLIVDTYSYIWEPCLWFAQKNNLKRPTSLRNWLSHQDLANFLALANFEVVTSGGYLLVPYCIPLVAWLCNTYLAPLPGMNRLCLNQWIIARPKPLQQAPEQLSISIVIPCKNERGNIEAAITRTPLMGASTEFIFVEGGSHDGTREELERVAALYLEQAITILQQTGKGKGDAVRKGFAHARGDVLMILDADLTMPPEELPKFFNALVEGKGEFINGSRLVYGMEDQAMRFLNLLANYGFALIFSWLLGQRIKDTLCGTKVLYKKDYKQIVANRSYFGDFDPFGDFDLLFGAAKLNRKIVDMPVHYKNRSYGTTQISRFKHGFLLLRMSLLAMRKFKFR